MKKILLIIGTILGLSLLYTSCNVNSDQVPKFNEKDAFVGFTTLIYTVDEDFCTNPQKGNGQNYKIPVTLASVSGLVSSVKIVVKDSTAIAGVNYILKSGNTLNFTTDARTQYVEFEIIDIPGEFTGDFMFKIEITDGGSVNVGSDNICSVKIADMDHPLSSILGVYIANGCGYWDGDYSWNVTIKKDDPADGKAPDLSKVWLYNFIEGGQNVDIYGTVNAELTEIRIPMGQTTVLRSGAQYAAMVGWHVFYYEDGTVNEDLDDEVYDIQDGYNMVVYIENDGQKMYLPPLYEFGSYIPDEDAWYNILLPFPVPGGGKWDYDMNRPMMTLIKN